MLALCVITMANVLVRYFTDISFAFTEEISVALMVIMTFAASAKAFLDGNQIAVVWFVRFFSAANQRRLALVSLAASIAMFAIVVWYGGRMAWDDYRFEVTSPGIGAPQWIYTVWLPLLALAVIGRLAQGVRDVLRGRLAEERGGE
jgi:TRAP-type C4-dicarboxylate transport system permease small subunit